MSAAPRLQLNDLILNADDVASGIGISESLAPIDVVRVAREFGLRHVVQKDGFAFESELNAAHALRINPKKFLKDPLKLINGAGGRPQGSRLFNHRCDAGAKKAGVLDSFAIFLEEASATRRISDRAFLVADELYTNSSKNAWAAGAKLFEGPPCNKGRIEFFAQADHERLLIGCKDSFGNLDVQRILDRLAVCFRDGVADSIRRGPDGAGIGTYLVFESCVSYYAGVQKGRSTVICISMALGSRMRAAMELPKNIHLVGVD